MEESIARRLAELNSQFYAKHAEAFADTRPRLAAGVQRVLAQIPAGAKVLEVGCGDGKVGRALARAGVGMYVGVDESGAMLERARRYSGTKDERRKTKGGTTDDGRPTTENGGAPVAFLQADILEPGWGATLPLERFDWVLAFAVVHHVARAGRRGQVLKDLEGRLATSGTLVMSNWQLTRSERLLGKVRPWAEAGISESDVEPGDFLLGWERGGRRGLRYVHVITEAEARAMAAAAGLRVVEVFEADGVSGDLAQYVVMTNQVVHDAA